ncbi:hypothetical protein B0H13DRAFT_1886323 [Mycena leptocephala]|nr:hypothetical protein B0H13DRAFT_1886323 [Mycena leptocephala]
MSPGTTDNDARTTCTCGKKNPIPTFDVPGLLALPTIRTFLDVEPIWDSSPQSLSPRASQRDIAPVPIYGGGTQSTGVAGVLEPIDIQRESTPSTLRLYAPPTPRPTSCTGSDCRNGTKSLAIALAALVVYSSAMTLQEGPVRVHGKGREGRRAEDSETKICALSLPLPQPHASFDGRGEASDVAWALNDPPLRPDPIILPCTVAQSRASTISKRSVRRLSECWDRRCEQYGMDFKDPPPSRHPRAGIPATSRTRPSSFSSAISTRIDSPTPRSSALRTVLGSGQRQDHHPRVQGPPCDDSDPTITLFAPSQSMQAMWTPAEEVHKEKYGERDRWEHLARGQGDERRRYLRRWRRRWRRTTSCLARLPPPPRCVVGWLVNTISVLGGKVDAAVHAAQREKDGDGGERLPHQRDDERRRWKCTTSCLARVPPNAQRVRNVDAWLREPRNKKTTSGEDEGGDAGGKDEGGGGRAPMVVEMRVKQKDVSGGWKEEGAGTGGKCDVCVRSTFRKCARGNRRLGHAGGMQKEKKDRGAGGKLLGCSILHERDRPACTARWRLNNGMLIARSTLSQRLKRESSKIGERRSGCSGDTERRGERNGSRTEDVLYYPRPFVQTCPCVSLAMTLPSPYVGNLRSFTALTEREARRGTRSSAASAQSAVCYSGSRFYDLKRHPEHSTSLLAKERRNPVTSRRFKISESVLSQLAIRTRSLWRSPSSELDLAFFAVSKSILADRSSALLYSAIVAIVALPPLCSTMEYYAAEAARAYSVFLYHNLGGSSRARPRNNKDKIIGLYCD